MEPAQLTPVDILAANQRLLARRKAHQAIRSETAVATAETHNDLQPVSRKECGGAFVADAVVMLPAHLGWSSVAVTGAVREAGREEPSRVSSAIMDWGQAQDEFAVACDTIKDRTGVRHREIQASTVRHYPSLGIGALRTKQVPQYVVWLACRFLDQRGQGWLPLTAVRAWLTGMDSSLRLFGWRRLRQVLRQGNGRFWTWDRIHNQLWLFNAARVGATLQVQRFHGQPVLLPVSALTGGVGQFKAHLYGAWHSGRREANPISRQTQRQVLGVPERTQRYYEQRIGMTVQSNLAIGEVYTPEHLQKHVWRKGGAVFEFVDRNGRYGRKNGRYVAWQLPNSYAGPHRQTVSGRQRRINRQLTGLVQDGAQGNDEQQGTRRYFAHGAAAAQAFNLQRVTEGYWPSGDRRATTMLWSVFFAK